MRQMIKLMVMLLLLSITTTTNAAKVNATGVISSFEGTIEPFTNIDIAGAFDVTLAYGDSYSYKMEADEVFKTLNIFKVEEQTLYINLKGIKNNLKMKKGLPKIIIYVPLCFLFSISITVKKIIFLFLNFMSFSIDIFIAKIFF